MNLMPLIDRLQLAGVGIKGKSLFLQMMPAEARRAVMLRLPLSGMRINHELPGYFKGQFQLTVRAQSYEDGRELIEQAIDHLTIANELVEHQQFNYCRPCYLPVAFPLSKGNLVEYTVMFDCSFVEQD